MPNYLGDDGESVFLYVYGDDYSAMTFEQNYNINEVYKDMVNNGETFRVIDEDEDYIEIQIKTFKKVHDDFLNFVIDSLCDYDQLKGANIYRVE